MGKEIGFVAVVVNLYHRCVFLFSKIHILEERNTSQWYEYTMYLYYTEIKQSSLTDYVSMKKVCKYFYASFRKVLQIIDMVKLMSGISIQTESAK